MVITSTIQEMVRRTAFVTEEPTAVSAPGGNWAKVETYVIDGIAIEAVLPAALVVNRGRLLELAGGSEIRRAHEREESSGLTHGEAAGIVPLQPSSCLLMFVDVTLACAVRCFRFWRGKCVGSPALGGFSEDAQTRRRSVCRSSP
jgi:hypothetical protein